MDDNQSLKQQLEWDIANFLINKLEEGAITIEESSRIAQKVLTLIPDNESEFHLDEDIKKISQDLPELLDITAKYMALLDKEETDESVAKIQEKIDKLQNT